MYHAFPQNEMNVLGYRCSGTITKEEVQEIHREIQRTLDEHGTVRFLLHIADMELPEAKAVIEDFKLTSTCLGDVERYAIVGDARWHEWMSSIADVVTRGDARHFEARELNRAWAWVRRA